MSLSDELLWHSIELLKDIDDPDRVGLKNVLLRRSVSSSYYAVFHHICGSAATTIAPNVSAETNYRIRRWFDHAELKKVCLHFLPPKLKQPLLGLIGESASKDLRTVARNFIQLQDARHSADYDLSYTPTSSDGNTFIEFAADAIEAWERISNTSEANIFILSLLLWKNWEKER